MTSNVASVEEAIQGVREILHLDGADLIVNSAEEDCVDMTLVLEGVECLDCVLPRAAIERIVLTHVNETLPGISSVMVKDPREAV